MDHFCSTESLLVLVSVHYMGPINVADFQDAIDEAVRQAQSVRLVFIKLVYIFQ